MSDALTQATEAAARKLASLPELVDEWDHNLAASEILAAALPVILTDLANKIEEERIGDDVDEWNVALIKAAELLRAYTEGITNGEKS